MMNLKAGIIFSQNQRKIDNNILLDIKNSELLIDEKIVSLTKQEIALLKALQSGKYLSTTILKSVLNLNTEISVRTIINRVRKKSFNSLITQKRGYGYKLNLQEEFEKKQNPKENLESENILFQKIVDSSPIYIATFVHKQLFCINESFREFLGKDIIKELWDEEQGDFFQLIYHNFQDYEKLRISLFSQNEVSHIKMYDFKSNTLNSFKVQTYYFDKIDKHLLIFTLSEKSI